MLFERTTVSLSLALSVILSLAACSAAKPTVPTPGQENGRAAYVIGLGEIMGLTQMRHAKLWFAGRAGNWDLAAYELDEMHEGFDDAMRYHPRHKSAPEALTILVPQYTDAPLRELDTAIHARNEVAFTRAFDNLTRGCNGCHEAARFGFNVVTRPTKQTYSNQRFEP